MIATSTEIEYFIEVYQTKHVSKSALRLGITQPTLTQSLQKLEEKLQAKLFHRTKQGVEPTAAGTLFYSKAHGLLDSWSSVNRGVKESKTEIQGRFRVGCHQSVGAFTMPTLFKKLNEKAPGIEIDLVHDFSRKITERIVSYNIDLGYVVNPPKHPDLVLKKIGSDRVVFWKKRGLTNVPKRIFADANLAQIENLLGKTYRKNFKDWSLVQTSSLELIRTLTLSGQGMGVIPERVANADGTDLILFDKDLPMFHDEIYLGYRRDLLSSEAGKELVRLASFIL